MSTEALKATEAECAEGRTAPRVSLADIVEAAIQTVLYTTGSDAFPNTPTPLSLDVLTLCVVVMKNGFSIVGKSAPASVANFDAELGRKLAYEDAVRQIWPLMGFSLRDRLANAD